MCANHAKPLCLLLSFNFVYAEWLNETNELAVCVISPNGNIMGLAQAT